MGKFILAIVIGLIVYFALRTLKRRAAQSDTTPPPPATMVRCLHCGVHLPLAESLGEGNERYCCEEHRRLGRG